LGAIVKRPGSDLVRCGLVLLYGIGLAQGNAWAQDQGTVASQPALEEVVVTAEKRSERLLDVPLSIVALTAADLQNSGAVTLQDIGRQVPGLSIVTLAPGQNTLIIRGISSTGGTAPTVGFYIDDTPMSVANHLRGETDPVLFDLDRVEVLRGPQGTLYGASSEGGTVRYITKQPNVESFEAAAKQTFSYTENGGPNYEVDGMLNIPVSSTVAVRGSAVYRNYDGYIDRYPVALNDINGVGVGPRTKNVNTEQTTAANLAVAFKPIDELVITPSIMYQRILLGGAFAIDVPPGSFDNPIQTRDTDEPSVMKFTLISLPVHATLGPVSLVSSTAYNDGQYDSAEDNSKANYYYLGPAPQTYIYPGAYVTTQKTRVFTEELRASATVGRVDGLIGAYYSHERDFSYGDWPISAGYNAAFGTPFGAEPFFFAGGSWTTLTQLAAFGQLNIHITDKLEAILGERAFHLKQPNSATYTGFYNGGTSTASGDPKEHGNTPRFGLSYHVTPDAMVYANASKGFRPGNSVFLPQDICAADLATLGLSSPPSSYTSDSIWDYEIGEKFISQPMRLSVDTALFYIDWKNLQQTVHLPVCSFNFTGNFGAAVSKGVEFQVQYGITEALKVTAGGAFTQAELTQVVAGTQGNVGDALQNVPKWTGNVSLEYRTQIRPTISGFARFDVNASSRQFNNFDPTSNYYATAGYALANFRIGTDSSKDWQGSFFIDNLLDRHAETGLRTASGIDLPMTRAVSMNRPRTIGLDIRRNF
jgi:outer membrane receptor protein involved in Fe transport